MLHRVMSSRTQGLSTLPQQQCQLHPKIAHPYGHQHLPEQLRPQAPTVTYKTGIPSVPVTMFQKSPESVLSYPTGPPPIKTSIIEVS